MNVIRVAVADDEASARKLLVLLLETLGYEVVYSATDGADLIDQCLDRDVDLVLVDLDMPKMDGLAAAEVLAAKGIPVILISGHPDIANIVVENEPIVASLAKPASLDGLQIAIEATMAARRQVRPDVAAAPPTDAPNVSAEP
jgi:two-component system, response regulator PdtaR